MIDWPHVDELKADMGEAFDEVVAMFLEEAGEAVARLDPAAPADKMAANLHFLKGAALNLGFTEFAALCAQGESAAAAGNPESVSVPALAECYRQSVEEFSTGLAQR
jgi:histidine phosphotransfer protein HptB